MRLSSGDSPHSDDPHPTSVGFGTFSLFYNGGHRIVGDEVGCDLLHHLSLKRS